MMFSEGLLANRLAATPTGWVSVDSPQETGSVSAPLTMGQLGRRQRSHVLQLHLPSQLRRHQDGLQRPVGVTDGKVSPGASLLTLLDTLNTQCFWQLHTSDCYWGRPDCSSVATEKLLAHYWQYTLIFISSVEDNRWHCHPNRLTASRLSFLTSCEILDTKLVKSSFVTMSDSSGAFSTYEG